MKICLKTLAKREGKSHVKLSITERTPHFVCAPCELDCDVQATHHCDYFILELSTSGQLKLNCQRCLDDFSFDYHHQSILAVCQNEDVAERMMTTMDSMVSQESEINLIDMVTDELHLFCPEKHPNEDDCGELAHFINKHLEY